MTLLDKVIAGAIEDSLSTGALLRHMLMLGSRLKSEELVSWASGELNGYGTRPRTEYPSYRGPLKVIVQVMGVGEERKLPKTWRIDARDIPSEHVDAMLPAYLHHPLAELEKMAASDDAVRIGWPNIYVQRYNRWCREGNANHPDGFKAETVFKNVPASMIHGIVDTIRTRALMFALDLQTDYPDAGEINGPTTETEKVRESVTNNFNMNIYGGTNTVANGENFTQNVQIQQGDSQALLDFFKDQGLDEFGQTELQAALEEDGDKPGTGVAGFLKKMALGTFKFGGEAATPALTAAAKVGLGLFFGVPIP
jgi:hypothetical protein